MFHHRVEVNNVEKLHKNSDTLVSTRPKNTVNLTAICKLPKLHKNAELSHFPVTSSDP